MRAEELNTTFSSISDFLGDERIDRLKDYIVNSLENNLSESIRANWVVLPTEVTELWDDMLCDITEKLVKKYRKKLELALSEKVESYIKTLTEGVINNE